MDFLKRCGGSNFCYYSKIIQRACFSVLAYKGLLPTVLNDTLVVNLSWSQRMVATRRLRGVVVCSSRNCSSSSPRIDHRNRRSLSLEIPVLIKSHLNSLNDELVQVETALFVLKALDVDGLERLKYLTDYCFYEGGKLTRPTIVLLMAACCCSLKESLVQDVFPSQKKIAVVCEMIHTASLVHDDVIDESDQRRGRPSVSSLAGNKAAILIGDYILAKATQLLTRIGNPEVIILLAQVIEDLVKGEFMQLGSRATEDERFFHYMEKTFKKTASLFAHSCKAVAHLAGCTETLKEAAFAYGRNLGLAFQLMDDVLDFVAQTATLGKPAFADLRLGIATAPVLFAARQHSQMNELILRRFYNAGDVELAWNYVLKSDGISLTKKLAEQHCHNAVDSLKHFPDSQYKTALTHLALSQVSRER